MSLKILLFGLLHIFVAGCQKRGALAPSADPLSPLAAPPMGASVYNDELKVELRVLDELLENRIDVKEISELKKLLLEGRMGAAPSKAFDSPLAKIYLVLPELIHGQEIKNPQQKLWYKAKFLFLRRRFIESSMLMSELLKLDPAFHEARNWRARAIFFLGNPDLAVKELELIIKQSPNTAESLEARYLIGAIIYESNDLNPKRLHIGIRAWQEYMRLASNQANKEMADGLKELEQRLKGEGEATLAQNDPFAPNDANPPAKNAILKAFMNEELLLCEQLCDQALAKSYDKDIAIIKARILIKSGRMDEAATLFAKIVEKDQNYAPAHHYRGMAFMLKGQVKEALSSWQKTQSLSPGYARKHNLEQRIAVAEQMLGPTKIDMH